MRFYLLLFLLAFVDARKNPNNICSDDRRIKADECAEHNIFLTSSNFTMPKKLEDQNKLCGLWDQNLKCVQQYGKDCLRGFTAQVLNTGLFGIKKVLRDSCKNEDFKKKFMKDFNWLTKKKNKELVKCVEKSIANLEYIAESVEQIDQIPQSCCVYWEYRLCLTNQLNRIAPDGTETERSKKIDKVQKYTDKALTNLIEFLCSKQDSKQTCTKLMPAAMKRIEETFASSQVKAVSKSFMIPFLQVVVDI